MTTENMRTSKNGILFIGKGEAIVRSSYLDAGGVWTVGFGHTAAAGGTDPKSLNRAKRYSYKWLIGLFKHDLKKYEARVNKYIKVPLTQEQFDALVSFDYNTGGISKSTATRYINAGKSNKMIGMALMMWIKVNGKKSKGLIRRRMSEVRLYTSSSYGKVGEVQELQTNGRGELLWRSSSVLNLERLL